MPLAQIAQEPFSRSLDALGGRLLIRRVPGDRLHVKLARDSVIFTAGEMAEVQVQPQLLGSTTGGKVLMVAQLFAARIFARTFVEQRTRTGPDAGRICDRTGYPVR